MTSINRNPHCTRTQTKPMRLLLLIVILFAGVSAGQAQWTTDTSTNNIYYNAGNVGIGTSSPAYKLDVTSNFRLGSDGTSNIFNSYPSITSSGTNYYKAFDINAYQLPISAGVTESGYRIGLGVQGFVSDTNFGGTLTYQYGIWARHGSNVAASGSRIINSYGVFIDSLTTANTTIDNLYGLYQSSASAKNYFGGNVGIGTTSPRANFRLDVAGPVSFGQATEKVNISTARVSFNRDQYSGAMTDASVGGADLYNNGGDLTFETFNTSGGLVATPVVMKNNGNVGIGTTAPNYKLDVAGSGISLIGSGDVGAAVNITNTGKTATGTANYWNIYNMSGGYGNKLSFWAYAATNACAGGLCQDTLDIYDNGVVHVPFKLGIGTNDPESYKLKVSGDTNVTGNLTITGTGNITAAGTIDAGNIKARYQDVAEWVPSSEQLSAGTVVVLDSTKSNQVTSSTVSYDTRVAGVVSEQPGIALGEKSENKVLVATTGRVRVKVDASKGAIHIGDLLVTSDIPGVAMKSEPVNVGGVQFHRPGTLIGKALEPLEKGNGAILVLLSLQ